MKLSEAQLWVLRTMKAGGLLCASPVGVERCVWWRYEPEEPRPRITTVQALKQKGAIEIRPKPSLSEDHSLSITREYLENSDEQFYDIMQLNPAGRAALEAEDA